MTRVVNEARVRAGTERSEARDLGVFLIRSRSAGKRLVGLAFLQEAPEPGALEDVLGLVSGSATAFEMFHALVAIKEMSPLLTASQKEAAIETLEREKDDPRGIGVMDDANLPTLIDQVLDSLVSG